MNRLAKQKRLAKKRRATPDSQQIDEESRNLNSGPEDQDFDSEFPAPHT